MLFVKSLENAQSLGHLNVNGSLANPKTFMYAPGSIAGMASVKSLTCVLVNPGSSAFQDFKTELPNGILLQAKLGTKLRMIKVIKTKKDLLSVFSADVGFKESPDLFMGSYICDVDGMTLDNSDYVSVTIQDDLSSIEVFSMSALVWLK